VIFRVSDSKEEAQKSNKRLTTKTIIGETKREGQRKAKRCTTYMNQKKRRELVPLMVGSYLTHNFLKSLAYNS
jgi:hypothetical protein